MKEFDVVIIGAGLAGLQCARLLSRHGAKILLVDRKTDLTRGIHTTGIFVRKTLEDFDFPAGTLGKPVKNVTLYSPQLKSLNLESEKDEFRVGKMGKLYESFLKVCLECGVEFSNGTRYLSTQTKVSESVVKLEKGGEIFEVETKVLIGADGARSHVAKDLNLDENKEWIVGYEEVYYSNSSSDEPRLHCFLDAKLAPGYLAWVSNDGEEIHVGVGGYAEKFEPREALKDFKKKIAGKIIDLDDAELTETRGGRIPVGGVLRRIANENGLLVGDAAGAVSPLTAGGLDPCLRLSKFAAEIVWKRLQTDNSKVLLDYSGELFRSRFVSRLWMRRLIALVSNQTLLEFGFAFLRGRIGKKFAEHVFFGRGSFPDLEIENGKIEKSLNTSVSS
ncbi:MAG TPA: NAD(P)/FAD-dependent oxidoreductase [Pyrinomonadaceae bacterium]|nr:NAD(P)/FAD-dependent oxidoreductase [Pyrinomonadaceae bacterium]